MELEGLIIWINQETSHANISNNSNLTLTVQVSALVLTIRRV